MQIKIKRLGFTLIELLVAIVIIGILATISTSTFRSYFGKARDVQRQTNIRTMATMVKVDQADVGGIGRFDLDATALTTLFSDNDFPIPVAERGKCYFFAKEIASSGSTGDSNLFAFVVANDAGTDHFAEGSNGALANTADAAGADLTCSSTTANVRTALGADFANATVLEIDGSATTPIAAPS